MKVIFFSLLALLFVFCSPKSTVVTEEYFQITNDNTINPDKVIATRTLNYCNGEFKQGTLRKNGNKTVLYDDHWKYNPLSLTEHEKNLIVRDKAGNIVQVSYLEGDTTVIHRYQYNTWGDMVTDSCFVSIGQIKAKTVLTFEYFYLGKFTHATNSEGVTAISGYVDDFTEPWVRCTVKKDGKIIEHINRKYKNLP